MATNLPKLRDVEKLSTSVIRVMGGNPNKFTLQGSNTYILGRGPSRILIDTAEGQDHWKHSMTKVLTDENISISECILTHWHHDHIGGVSDLQSLSPSTTIWKASGNSIDPDNQLSDIDVKIIHDGTTFSTDDDTFEIQAIFCPGHTKDHTAFQITRSTDTTEIGAMFTADNVLGHGTAVFENLAVYLHSLGVMQARVPRHQKSRAYPGHGAVVEDAAAKIVEYIDHRKMREEEALNVLKFGTAKKPASTPLAAREVVQGKPWKSMEMVKVIYADVPEHLHLPAERGLLMVLQKLKGEGRVVEIDGTWKVSEKATL